MGNYPTLPQMDADDFTVTLSGFGSGCAMAQQFSIIYSSEVAGVALFNCWPYGVDYSTDLKEGQLTEAELAQLSIDAIEAAELAGDINPTVAMARQSVYIYSGGDGDTTAPPRG